MKRCGIILLVCYLLLLVSLANAENQSGKQGVFHLPSSVKVIEDEAFSGTAAESVVLQDNVEFIGEKAFADIPTLSDIYIPKTTQFIAENAFWGVDVTIHGIEGSFADQWAKERGYRFIHEDIWCPMGMSNNFLKLRAARSIIYIVCQWSLVLICFVSSLYRRNRKCVKDYPELHAIDLAFP